MMKIGNIVIVDDYDLMLRLCKMYLKDYNVKTFSSTESAEEFLRENPEWPALVLSDNDAPKEGAGLKLGEVAKLIGCEFILMSAGNTKALEVLAEERGYSFLEKPFERESLLRAVEDCIDKALVS